MKKITLFILAIIIAGTAIAKHKHKKKHTTGSEIIAVGMRRTACFGRCPDYKIEIDKDGMATYTGIRFTADTGVFKKNIGASKAIEIINQFETYRVDTCRNRYVSRMQDMPGLVITIKYKDSTKMIMDANFGPSFLSQLAAEIDEMGKKTDDTWKRP